MKVVVTTGATSRAKKALVKLSPQRDQHTTFYRHDILPVAQPTVSKHRTLFINMKKSKCISTISFGHAAEY